MESNIGGGDLVLTPLREDVDRATRLDASACGAVAMARRLMHSQCLARSYKSDIKIRN